MSGPRTSSIALQAVEDVVGLERHHASEGDASVAHLLQLLDAVGVTGGTPALGGSDRFDATALVETCADELLCQAKGQRGVAPPKPDRRSQRCASGS